MSHLQDLLLNNFNIAGLNNDWNLKLFSNMKKRGILLDTMHFASEFTQAFQLTLNLLTTTIVAPPSNASKWQMGFNSVFKGLIISLYNYIWKHSNCLTTAVDLLNKTNKRTKLIFTGNGKWLFVIGRWSIALKKNFRITVYNCHCISNYFLQSNFENSFLSFRRWQISLLVLRIRKFVLHEGGTELSWRLFRGFASVDKPKLQNIQ